MAPDIFKIARYKMGDTAYWVNFLAKDDVKQIPEKDDWVRTHHPKVVFERGYFKSLWKTTAALPRLEKTDFMSVMHILTCELNIDEFLICRIARSHDTGEFFYSNEDEEWMPESFLFDSKVAAAKEQKRIKTMIKKWCDT
jgi:hypothetical protein